MSRPPLSSSPPRARARSSRASWLLALGWLGVSGCVVSSDEPYVDRVDGLDYPGPWLIPADTLAVGDAQYVPYAGAGLWNDGADCSGGLLPGTGILRSYLLAHFPQTSVIGGYSCRQNTGNTAYMSIHAVGRALDIMLPKSNATADNDLGDPIGNWLIENAETIGIQYIIWDEWTWLAARTPGQKGRLYTGPNPHHDHLHVELGAEAGARTVDWFSSLVSPPTAEGCEPLGPFGGVIDDVDPCFQLFGPSQYWRSETGVGHGGSLRWTNAFTSTSPSNWARWNVALEEAGEYDVEVFLTPPFAVYAATRYAVRHEGTESVVFVDQAAESAGTTGVWVSLGVHTFASGADQWVSVYDNVAGSVASSQHVTADALRLTRIGMTPPDDGPIDEAPMDEGPDPDVDIGVEPISPPSGHGRGGCAITEPTEGSNPSFAIVLVAGVVALRRRRAR